MNFEDPPLETGLPEAEEERPEEGDPQAPRNFAVLSDSGVVDPAYPVGIFQLGLGAKESSEVIVITEADNKIVVALPESVWHRTPAKRLAPSRCLIKPALISVAAVPRGDRETGEDLGFSLKAWVGILDPRWEGEISFDEDEEPGKKFGGEVEDILPLAQALVDVANEQYAFLTAESGVPGQPEARAPPGAVDTEERIQVLEAGMLSIQESLQQLLKKPQVTFKNPTSKAKPKPAVKKDAKTVAGLDGGVVQSALTAGIPLSHLRQMGDILRERPRRLDDVPRKALQKEVTPLDEEEFPEEGIDGEEYLEEEEAEPGGDSNGSGVGEAIKQLTKIAAHLTESRKKDPLELLLDGGGGTASSSDTAGLPGSKKNSAALRALQKQLQENPRYIFQMLEANMQADFLSRPVAPGEPTASGCTVRGWLASKSRVQLYTNHVRWMWQVSGIWDALIAGRVEEARARCGLLVAAGEQSSIDGGSWLISSVSLMEQPPPYQMFAHHQAPSNLECQHSILYDPRWVEVFMGHVREVDTYQEAKKKLSKGGGTSKAGDKEEELTSAGAAAKAKAKAKAERLARLKAAKSQSGESSTQA